MKDRADQRLAGVGEDRRAQAAAGVRFRRAEAQRRADVDRARDLGAGLLAHEIGEAARQLAFVGLRKGAEQHVGDDEAEDVVAEEFETLVAVDAGAARGGRDVRQRPLEQRLVGEVIADALFERASVLDPAAAHLTIVNSRVQRTENGQRQNSQARSPS